MKKLMVLFALAGSTAYACPDFTGTYVFKYEGGEQTIAVTQAEENGVTTYTLTSEGETSTVVADGQTRTSTNKTAEGIEVVMSDSNACVGDSLVTTYAQKALSPDGQLLVEVTGTQTAVLDEKSNIKIHDVMTNVTDNNSVTETDSVLERQ